MMHHFGLTPPCKAKPMHASLCVTKIKPSKKAQPTTRNPNEWTGRKMPASDALLHIPHKGAETKERVVNVKLTQTVEQGLDLCVLHNGEDGTVHGWPGMAAQMGFARL